MKNLGLLFKVGFKKNFVSFFFSLTENNGSTVSTTIKVDNIGDD